MFFISAPLVARAALVNINTAGIEELDTLDGIGPAYAQRIIDHRITNGPFEKIEDIQNVKGIGEATFAKIKSSITVGESSDEKTQTSVQNQSHLSSHYGAEDVSASIVKKEEVYLSAGRNRVGIAGGRLEFKAETSLPLSHRDQMIWNLGDGTVVGGEVVTHAYEYPGEYIVILNGQISGRDLTSRVSVKITLPALEITAADSTRVEITNNSDQEANLFGRAIVSKDGYFIFPKDTIVGPKQNISFSSRVTGLSSITESNAKIIVLKEGALVHDIQKEIDHNNSTRINNIKNSISQLQQKINAIQKQQTYGLKEERSSAEEIVHEKVSQSALALESFDGGEKRRSFSWFQSIKNFFLKTK